MAQNNRTKYISDWKKQNYDRFNLLLQKGMKEKLQSIAQNQNLSVNALINIAIQDYIASHQTESNTSGTD